MATKPKKTPAPTSVELFTGAGGLALGVAGAGFEHKLLLEYNRHACETLRQNRKAFGEQCEIHEGDVKAYKFAKHKGVDLLAAGAPCQPFSIGGKHQAHKDERNLFPQVFRATREMRPKAVIIENVKGLLRASLASFVEYIELQMAHPMVLPEDPLDPEAWMDHLPKLREVHRKKSDRSKLQYIVKKALLNSANFGVPQKRERVFFVAIRKDLGVEWLPPTPTHSKDALRAAQNGEGGYWRRHGVRTPAHDEQIAASLNGSKTDVAPWVTLRDVIVDLPVAAPSPDKALVPNHVVQPGARAYPGHTGSPLDGPAKTLKAGVHGVPGGENMIRINDETVRYLTVREAARVQAFPDTYVFRGAWGEAMRQIGNAVPVKLAEAVVTSVRQCLERANQVSPQAPAFSRNSKRKGR